MQQNKFHYTYLLLDNNGKMYIGARSCIVHPIDDNYWSSSKYVLNAITKGIKFNKQILSIWNTRKEAINHEILLHEIFDVAKNQSFYNKAKQTSTKFDTTGFVFSEEQKLKISIASKRKRNKSPFYKECKLKNRKQSLTQIANRAKAQTGKMGMKNNKSAKPIFAINLATKEAKLLVGRTEVSNFGFDPSTVHRICHKKPSSFTHKKHTFRFLCQNEIKMFVLDKE